MVLINMDEIKNTEKSKNNFSNCYTNFSPKSLKYDREPKINFDNINSILGKQNISYRSKIVDEQENSFCPNSENITEYKEIKHRRKNPKKVIKKNYLFHQCIILGLGIFILILLVTCINFILKIPSSTLLKKKITSTENIIELSNNEQNDNFHSKVKDTSTGKFNNNENLKNTPLSSEPLVKNQDNPSLKSQTHISSRKNLFNKAKIRNPDTNYSLLKDGYTLRIRKKSIIPPPYFDMNQKQRTTISKHKTYSTLELPTTENKHEFNNSKYPIKSSKYLKVDHVSDHMIIEKLKKNIKNLTNNSTTSSILAIQHNLYPEETTILNGKIVIGNIRSYENALSNKYTLQLSSASNYRSLYNWAKKVYLKDYVIYETIRNKHPWYVLIRGIYGSKNKAEFAIPTLSIDIQENNPWAKPIYQVHNDLKTNIQNIRTNKENN